VRRREFSPTDTGAGSGANEGGARAKLTVKETIDAVEDQGFREILSSLAKAIGRKDK
jgi:hypothetical protein